ncbi:unnamed protein product [Mytilus edulis]|uniref:Tc1-like transposase DDE domain-containing protein n=1 Tax=Mytilus edulis TaxID=6550 RepID=A0A8S3UFR0_MYTED|nr:unnamed protein product [Mytilus edulis]
MERDMLLQKVMDVKNKGINIDEIAEDLGVPVDIGTKENGKNIKPVSLITSTNQERFEKNVAKSVLNLSNRLLTNEDYLLLGKGLTFIPLLKFRDNDSKHKSKSTKAWMTQKNMLNKVMECPASSPDINVIENVWASMKYYLESTVKPKLKEELVNGIKQFWENLSAEQCARYIDHIHRVLPVVVLNDGGPSGF